MNIGIGIYIKNRYTMTPGIPHILIFSRYPAAGGVKTRLIRALGPEGAARLHRRLTEHVVGVARAARNAADPGTGVGITVCCTGAPRRAFRTWLGTDLQYAPQASADLGARMERAFDRAFRRGAVSAVLIGTDVPCITSDILHQALQALRGNDMVLGRASDGGYYLIGSRAPPSGAWASPARISRRSGMWIVPRTWRRFARTPASRICFRATPWFPLLSRPSMNITRSVACWIVFSFQRKSNVS